MATARIFLQPLCRSNRFNKVQVNEPLERVRFNRRMRSSTLMSAETNSGVVAPETEVGLSRAWRALRHRNFRLFFGGQSISLIGTWMTRLATSWLVYRLTGSAFLLGMVGFSGQIPTFLLAPFAGVWVDRLNRRQVLIVTQILAMLQSFALAVLTLTRHITIHEIIWLSIFQGMINAFDMPGRQAFLGEMVEDRQDLGTGGGWNGDCGFGRRRLLLGRRD